MPSLTLADPDMILPSDGSERESQTPSPPSQLLYLSNLNAHSNSADLNACATGRGPKNYSRHNWTYEDMNASRRLSDIGEELSPARSDRFDDGALPPELQQQKPLPQPPMSPLGSKNSPRLKQLAEAERQYSSSLGRRGSSGSTVSARSGRTSREAHSPHTMPEISPNSSLGEPRQSNESVVQGPNGTRLPENIIAASTVNGKGPGEDLSSVILSSEAERILENAKRRLTVRREGPFYTPANVDLRGHGRLTDCVADGRKPESRPLDGASDAFIFAIGTAPRGIVSIDLQSRPQNLSLTTAVHGVIPGCLGQPTLTRPKRNHFPCRVESVERRKAPVPISLSDGVKQPGQLQRRTFISVRAYEIIPHAPCIDFLDPSSSLARYSVVFIRDFLLPGISGIAGAAIARDSRRRFLGFLP